MEIRTLIDANLWDAVSKSYESGNYQNAITDAIDFLRDRIREKSSLDLDGSDLINHCLGGKNPLLKINKFQTQSEKDEQEGFQLMLSGLFKGVRNPRAHTKLGDTKNDADPIVFFVNYLITKLDLAKAPFTIEKFIDQVMDPYFVERADYAKELIDTIPEKKYWDTLIELYRQKAKLKIQKISLILVPLVKKLNDKELEEFLKICSEDLSTNNDHNDFVRVIALLSEKGWRFISNTARMRVENKLIESIKEGKVSLETDETMDGIFGTWTRRILDDLYLKVPVRQALFSKIVSGKNNEKMYVFKYFLVNLPILFKDRQQIGEICKSLSELVSSGNYSIRILIRDFLYSCPKDWYDKVMTSMEPFTDSDNPEFYTPSGDSLFGKTPSIEDNENIPF